MLIVSLGVAGSIDVHANTSASPSEVSPSNLLLWRAGLLSSEELSNDPWETIVRDIDELLALDTDFDKYRAISSMVRNCSNARLDEIFEQSAKIEDDNLRQTVRHHVLRVLAYREPERALDIAVGFPSYTARFLISGVFRTWADTDFSTAANRAKKLEEPHRTIALESILVYRYRLTTDQKHELELELGEDYDADALRENSYSNLTVEELRKAWNSMIGSHFLGDYRVSSLRDIAAAWLDISDYQFHFVSSLCRTMPNVYERDRVIEFILSRVSRTDLQPAFELAVQCHENQMDSPLITVVAAWGHREPLEALKAISSMELTPLRYPLQRVVINEWASIVPDKVLRNREPLPSEFREWGVARAVRELAWHSPRRAARLISKVHADYWDEVEPIIAAYWSRSSWKATLRWLESRSKRGKTSVDSWFEVLRRIVEEDLKIALKVARRNSYTNDEDGLEFIVVVEVARKDLDQAKLFLAEMSDSRAKFVAVRELGKFLLDRNRFDEAIELRDLLIETERSGYLQSLFEYWAESDPVELFTWVNNTDPSDLRNRGAFALEKADARRKSLSDAEMQQIRSLALLNE